MKLVCLLLFVFSFSFAGIAQRSTDPSSPGTPVYAGSVNPGSFNNIVFPGIGNVYVSTTYTGLKITDGTGVAEYDDYVTDDPGTAAYLIMDVAALKIGTHIFSDNPDPIRHDYAGNTITQQSFEFSNAFIENPGWTYLFGRNDLYPSTLFPQLSKINFKNYILNQSIGTGTSQPVGLSNVIVTIDGVMTFTNGRMYAVRQAASNLNVEEVVFLSGASTSGGSTTSYLDGPMRLMGTASSFKYVLGDQGIYSPLTYTASNAGTNGTVVRYFASGGGNTTSLSTTLASVSPEEYFAITTTETSAALTLNTANFSSSYSGTNWTIAGYNSSTSQWVNLAPGGGSGTLAGSTVTVTGADLSNITKIAPALAKTLTVLPLDFLSFSAVAEGEQAKLSWTVGDVVNVSHFEVERSCDGKTFTAIGRVALNGSGAYGFRDAQPCTPLSYYRIRSVDADAKTKLSAVRPVGFGVKEALLVVWPNPAATPVLHVSLSGQMLKSKNGQWILRNASGQLVRKGAIADTAQTLSIPLDGLAKGHYLITITTNDGITQTKPFIKQ